MLVGQVVVQEVQLVVREIQGCCRWCWVCRGGCGAGGPPSAIFIYVLCKNDYIIGKKIV